MKINWTHGFNLKEEKRFLTNTLKSTETLNKIKINNNAENNQKNKMIGEIDSDVVKLKKDILEINKDIVEMNMSITSANREEQNAKIFNKITKTETLDSTKKEHRNPKRENIEQKNIVKKAFQNKKDKESFKREHLE